jgi:protein TonB
MRLSSRFPRRRDKTCSLPSYRLPKAHDRTPLRRRASGFALALAVNLGLLLVLLTLGVIPLPEHKPSRATIVDLLPESHSKAVHSARAAAPRTNKPVPKPPPIILPVKPTIAPPPQPSDKPAPWVELSHDQMAAADLRNLPKADPGAGDSEEVGRGPHGEVLYAAEWAREPTDAELAGYLPKNGPEGWGLIACKTIEGNRVDDCVELGQSPAGSHLASAVRQAAWQFRVRPPRKNGKPLIGEWVRIRIDYERFGG